MILPITMTFAAAAALLHIWLSSRVVRARRAAGVGIGDGGNEAVLRRMRAHANFAENVPIVLILFGLVELAGGDRRILWGVAIAFVLARISHAFGMDRREWARFRMVGMGLNAAILLGLAAWALTYAYRLPAPPEREQILIGPGRSA